MCPAPDDRPSIADLQAQVADLQAQVADLRESPPTDGFSETQVIVNENDSVEVVEPFNEGDVLDSLPIEFQGDLIAGDAAGAPGVLSVGSPGQVLAADPAAALGVSWQDQESAAFLSGGSGNYQSLGSGTVFDVPVDIPTGADAVIVYLITDGKVGDNANGFVVKLGTKAFTKFSGSGAGEAYGPTHWHGVLIDPPGDKLLRIELPEAFAEFDKHLVVIAVKTNLEGEVKKHSNEQADFRNENADSKLEENSYSAFGVESGTPILATALMVRKNTSETPTDRSLWAAGVRRGSSELVAQFIYKNRNEADEIQAEGLAEIVLNRDTLLSPAQLTALGNEFTNLKWRWDFEANTGAESVRNAAISFEPLTLYVV